MRGCRASESARAIETDAFVFALRDLNCDLGFILFSLDGLVEEQVGFDQSTKFPCANVWAGEPKTRARSEPVLFVEDRNRPYVACNPELKAGVHVEAGAPADSGTRRDSKGTELS